MDVLKKSVKFRPVETNDELGFVRSTAFKAMRKHKPMRVVIEDSKYSTVLNQGTLYSHMPFEIYAKRFDKYLNSLVMEAQILLAIDPDEHTNILGFMIYRVDQAGCLIISYVYVKSSFRKMKVATQLIQQVLITPTFITHLSPWLATALKNKPLIFDPTLDYRFFLL